MTSPSRADEPSPPSPARRRKGRPQANGDASVGREAIIAATRQMLRRLPPLRISRAEVAREIGADPSLIRYYFGKKSSLLLAVVLQIAEELSEKERHVDADAPVVERLRQRISGWIHMLIDSPHLHNVLLQKIVYGEVHDDEEKALIRQELVAKPLSALQALIDEGVRRGEFRPVDVNMLYVALIGMCEFAATAFPLFEILEGQEAAPASTVARYIDFVTDLLVGGLAARTSVRASHGR